MMNRADLAAATGCLPSTLLAQAPIVMTKPRELRKRALSARRTPGASVADAQRSAAGRKRSDAHAIEQPDRVAPQRRIPYQAARTARPDLPERAQEARGQNPGSPHRGLAMMGPPVDNSASGFSI
jgi:hypothetical protein